MPNNIIVDNQIVQNQWLLIDKDAEDIPNTEEPIIVPLSLWNKEKRQLLKRKKIGIYLESDESPQLIAEDLSAFDLIAINFNNFADGRGFTYGRELRDTHGFKGEIRAIGSFIRDQLFFLKRCGFNAFALENANLQESLSSLTDFSDSYQAAIDQPNPLYNRR